MKGQMQREFDAEYIAYSQIRLISPLRKEWLPYRINVLGSYTDLWKRKEVLSYIKAFRKFTTQSERGTFMEQSMEQYLLMQDKMQKEFDAKYVTASELCLLIGVDRSVLSTSGKKGRKKGPKLPGYIEIVYGNLTIWERDFIMPYANKWKAELELRRTPRHLRNKG